MFSRTVPEVSHVSCSNHAVKAAQARTGDPLDGMSVDRNGSPVHVIEAHEQLMTVVLLQPVGPTMAILCPGLTETLKSLNQRPVGPVGKETCSAPTLPSQSARTSASGASGVCPRR